MIIKKKKAVIAAILSAALTASALMPTVSAVKTQRTEPEAFGDKTYASRFLSLYDDVITKGEKNGYLSSQSNNPVDGGFGIPYHSVEELVVEAPDYGHETTSEAMSYIVWMAAMRDILVNDGAKGDEGQDPGQVGDIKKAWQTMKVMVPTVQTGFWQKNELSAQYSPEQDTPSLYPQAQRTEDTAKNPIHKYFTSAYRGDNGLFLLHWLADVDDWYGYGGGNGKFTFINTFQRGAEESCWETVPHGCVEELKYGAPGAGVKGIFDASYKAPMSWSYTNAPDAEDRAIQAIYFANRYNVNIDSNVISEAGKMGDELRNNMYDKYYQAMGAQSEHNLANDPVRSAHYLMSWYTSWGGAYNGDWAWQIGASHCHQFYQNPLAAYALLADTDLNSAMKAQNATKDYETSLVRQLEFYLWLQSKDGPIAGGATNSWHGRYLPYKYLAEDTGEGDNNAVDHDAQYIKKYGTDIPTEFYDMAYLEHPVYLDPGSNHWIGNQVWAVQRLAELYYTVKHDDSSVKDIKLCNNTVSIEDALKRILDRWVEWFINNTYLTADGDYGIPSTLDWNGQPKTWENKIQENDELTCEIKGYGNADLGCVSSLANTLIWYAAANDVDASKARVAYKVDAEGFADKSDATPIADKALYLAHTLLDREWIKGRDNIGLTRPDTNGSMWKLFEQEVWVPEAYGEGPMPGNQGTIKNGIKFLDIRQKYLENEQVKAYKVAYDKVGKTHNEAPKEVEQAMKDAVELKYHRFWHAGDIMLALGTMAKLYPDVKPDDYADSPNKEDTLVVPDSIEVEVDKTKDIDCNVPGSTFTSADDTVAKVDADGTVTGVKEGTTTIKVTTPEGQEATIEVTVKATGATDDTDPSGIPTGSFVEGDYIYGDVNLDGDVTPADIVQLVKFVIAPDTYPLGKGTPETEAQAKEQGNVEYDSELNTKDSGKIKEYILKHISIEDLGPGNK